MKSKAMLKNLKPPIRSGKRIKSLSKIFDTVDTCNLKYSTLRSVSKSDGPYARYDYPTHFISDGMLSITDESGLHSMKATHSTYVFMITEYPDHVSMNLTVTPEFLTFLKYWEIRRKYKKIYKIYSSI